MQIPCLFGRNITEYNHEHNDNIGQ